MCGCGNTGLAFGKESAGMSYYFSCPSCGNNSAFNTVREQADSTGCLLLFFGGLLPYIFYSSSRVGRVQCSRCGYIFHKPGMPKSPISVFAFWVVAVMCVGLFFIVFLAETPASYENLLENAFINAIVSYVAEYPEAVAIGMLATFAMVTLLCIIVYFVANHKERNRIRARYETEETYLRQESE